MVQNSKDAEGTLNSESLPPCSSSGPLSRGAAVPRVFAWSDSTRTQANPHTPSLQLCAARLLFLWMLMPQLPILLLVMGICVLLDFVCVCVCSVYFHVIKHMLPRLLL